MKIKLFAATAIVLGALSVTAEAATWTITSKGTISGGTDTTGVFGTAGQQLAGLSFTHTITSSIDVADWPSHGSNSYLHYIQMYGAGPGFTDTVTVNGHSVTFVTEPVEYGHQLIANDVTMADGHGYIDYVYTEQTGSNIAGDTISATTLAYSRSVAFVPTASFFQNIGPVNVSSSAFSKATWFSVSGTQKASFYSNEFDTFSVTAVPEPQTYAMMLAGLGLVGFAARRKRAVA